MHLVGNMWFLWIFGNNIEQAMGHARYLAFYLICGVLASASHIFSSPASTIPSIGASSTLAAGTVALMTGCEAPPTMYRMGRKS